MKSILFACRLPKYYNVRVSLQRNFLIKLSNCDETKKSAHDSQIIRAKENLMLSHGGPSKRQAPGVSPDQLKEETITIDRDWCILSMFYPNL